jgi:hypothetical protein
MIAPVKARERSVVTSVGMPGAPMAPAKERVAALLSRFFDANTSMS